MPKAKKVPIPTNLVEASELLAIIGRDQRAIAQIDKALDEHIQGLQELATASAQPYLERIKTTLDRLYAYAETNRRELTRDGKAKTIYLKTGTFSWRFTPPAVKIAGSVADILKELRKRRLKRFIRVKTEIDRQAMLKDPKAASKIPGVSFTHQEEFVATPAETNTEVVTKIKKQKKSVDSNSTH